MTFNKILAITFALLITVVAIEFYYYRQLPAQRSVNLTQKNLMTVANNSPSPVKTINNISFQSGADVGIKDNVSAMPHRADGIMGKIIQVGLSGLSVLVNSKKTDYLFNSTVYLFLRNHPRNEIGYSSLKTGENIEFSLDRQNQKQLSVIIIED